jgi:hypothetical protein
LSWTMFVRGNHSAIHLRDGCPGLPYAGRRVVNTPDISTEAGMVAQRASAIHFRGGIWGEVAKDRSVLNAMATARRDLATRLSAFLGRVATVSDLPLLGGGVTLFMHPQRQADEKSPLVSFVY